MYRSTNRSNTDATFICTVLVAIFANCRANHRLSYWPATTCCIYRAPDKAQGTQPDKLEFVVFQKSEIARRHDVRVASKGFETEIEALAEITRLGGVIPTGVSILLDFFDDENLHTVWCWKDERTRGASQVFKSEREAIDALANDQLVFDALLG